MPKFELEIDKTKLKTSSKDAVKVLADVGTQADKTKTSVDNIGKTNMKTLESSISGVASKLATLYASFVALQKVMGYVNNGFRMSSSVEDAQISIASILSATNDIADAQGKMYTGQEKFAKSLGISETLIKEIQVLALETSATFESIVQSVGGMVAPATQAGLAVEDIPKFAVKATQAMNAMQIPVQQMRTEMEALFTGNINKAQDILATNLGITGEMVRDWKEQGILVDMLNEKLESFAFSGEAIANSWSGLTSNLQDAFDFISSQTSSGMFEGAKQSYRELLDLLINTEGELGIGTDIKNITKAVEDLQNYIGNQLLEVTRDFIDYIEWLNKPDNLSQLREDFDDVWTSVGNIADLLGTVLSYVGKVGQSAFDAWQKLPEPIQSVGLVGAIFGGAKGAVAITGILSLVDSAMQSARGFGELFNGNLSFNEFASMNSAELDAYFKSQSDNLQDRIEALEFANNQYLEEIDSFNHDLKEKEDEWISFSGMSTEELNQGIIERQRMIEENNKKIKLLKEEEQKILNDIASQQEGGSSFVGPMPDWSYKGDKPTITSNRGAGGVSLTDSEISKRENALKSLNEEFAKLTMTDEEFETYKFNERMKEMAQLLPNQEELINKIRQAQEKMWASEASEEAKQKQEENFDAQLAFYEKFAEETGKNTRLIELQNQAIDKQVAIWREIEIPEEFIEELERVMRAGIETSGTQGLLTGIDDYFNQATDLATEFSNVYQSTMDGFVSTTWEALKTGEGNWKDYASSVIDMLGQMATQYAIVSALGSFGDTETGEGASGIFGSLASIAGSLFHTGGMVNNPTSFRNVPAKTFDNAPRYHTGYNPNTEQPAILLKNERVLDPNETYAYNKGLEAGGGSSSGGNITVNQTVNIQAQGGMDSQGFTQEQINGIQKQMKTSIQVVVQEEFLKQQRVGGGFR